MEFTKGKREKEEWTRTCAKKLLSWGKRLSDRSGLGVLVPPPGGVFAPEPMSDSSSWGLLVSLGSAGAIL